MKIDQPARFAALLGTALLLLLIDFLSKAYVHSLLPFASNSRDLFFYDRPIFENLLGGISFSISLAYNKGIAWGLFSDFWIIIVIARMVIIATLLVYLFFSKTRQSGTLPLVFIIVGACGNIIDCFLYGNVVDFLRFSFWNYHFPIFNVADTLITVGVLALFGESLLQKKSSRVLENGEG